MAAADYLWARLPAAFSYLPNAVHFTYHIYEIRSGLLNTLQLDSALLGSAALDFPMDGHGGGMSNHMHQGTHDVYQQQYHPQHNPQAMLPEMPMGGHPHQNTQSLGLPGQRAPLQSDSLAAFMDELKSSILDP